MTPETPSLVFISYSRKDARHLTLVRKLLLVGMVHEEAVFVDSKSIGAGQKWEETLDTAIRKAQIFVVLWSWHASRSKWVKREIALATAAADRDSSRRIIPILMDRTPLCEALKPYQAISATGERCPLPPAVEILGASVATCTLAVASIAAHMTGHGGIVSLVGLVSMWIAIAAFTALRSSRAPWNEADRTSGLLLGVIRVGTVGLTVLLLGSLIAVIMTVLLAAVSLGMRWT